MVYESKYAFYLVLPFIVIGQSVGARKKYRFQIWLMRRSGDVLNNQLADRTGSAHFDKAGRQPAKC